MAQITVAGRSDLVYQEDPGIIDQVQEISGGIGFTNQGWEQVGFDPAKTTSILSYTSARMARNLFNSYDDSKDDFKVICYYANWACYDGRIGDDPSAAMITNSADWGRGVDITKYYPESSDWPFNRFVASFGGIYNGPGQSKYAAIEQTFDQLPFLNPLEMKGSPIYTDAWADMQAYRNFGHLKSWWQVGGGNVIDEEHYNQESVLGLIGAFRNFSLYGNSPSFSISIGGWTLSDTFSEMVASEEQRSRFISGLRSFFKTFPLFTHLDIDWEYPAVAGDSNNFDEENDGDNYIALIKAIKDAKIEGLNGISIAAPASLEKLQKGKIAEVINAGVDGVNLMTYDFLTLEAGSASKLSHHTNLYRQSNDEYTLYSVNDAVNYLIDNKVDPKKIFIGYAGYSRNAKNATLEQISPLKGTYSHDSSTVLGSFESGVLEWTDIICHYLALTEGEEINGYKLYTDTVADADFLYNENLKVFISLDTPRTVYQKAEYARKKGLGGIFVWTGDQDNGLLTNAAHEGLGRAYKSGPLSNMKQFYFKGDTGGGDDELPVFSAPAEPECATCRFER